MSNDNDIIDLSLIADIRASTVKWPDKALRLAYTRTGTDKAGKPIYSHVITGDPFICRFRPLTPGEVEISGEQEVMMGSFHCPRGITLNANDRVRITHKWGDPLAEQKDYELMGDPTSNALELTVIVKRVTSRSA